MDEIAPSAPAAQRDVGHGGYGGQYFIANPDNGAVAVFFSVLQDKDAGDKTYTSEVIRLLEEIVALY